MVEADKVDLADKMVEVDSAGNLEIALVPVWRRHKLLSRERRWVARLEKPTVLVLLEVLIYLLLQMR